MFGLPVGGTPLREVRLVIRGRRFTINLKMEGDNKFRSVKDRTAFFLLEDAEEKGLRQGGTVVESTSGNLGVALANLCGEKGYNFIAVIDPKTTQENVHRLEATGAVIELVTEPDHTGGYLLSRLDRVAELCRNNPAYFWTNQYGNPINPVAHFLTTAPEIYWQMRRRVDVIFMPVSTGGTLAGVSRFFRTASPSTIIVAVDAAGSAAFGGQPAPRKLTGIGSSRPAEFLDTKTFDELAVVGDAEAFAFCNALYKSTGLKVGGSSGATLAACAKFLASSEREFRRIVCICPDRGENYDSTIFNPRWLFENGFAVPEIAFPSRELSVELHAA